MIIYTDEEIIEDAKFIVDRIQDMVLTLTVEERRAIEELDEIVKCDGKDMEEHVCDLMWDHGIKDKGEEYIGQVNAAIDSQLQEAGIIGEAAQ